MMIRNRFMLSALLAYLVSSHLAADEREAHDFFEAKIRPVLVKHCYECHSAQADDVYGGLYLDTREATRAGGDTGPAVVANDLDASLLLKALRYEELEMPPDGKLPDRVIADFERWISMGAPDPREGAIAETAKAKGIDWDVARATWAFQSPTSVALPAVKDSTWPQQRHDYFVLTKLEANSLNPSPPASQRELKVRASFALTGLPPTESSAEWLEMEYERWIDQLISSPRFGERWARVWLDLARFAEDQAHIVGNNKSLFYPNAYLYRDWVIQAWNNDMPYDRFVQLQLAADLIEPNDDRHHVALGFIGLGPKYYDRKRLQVQADEWEDRVDTVSRGLLGLTVACARCHDHKYDPIPTEDYYALAGVFASTEMFNRPLPEAQDETESTKKKNKKNTPQSTLHIIREGKPRDLHVFVRGDPGSQGEVVPRGYLKILSDGDRVAFQNGSGRAELADAITRPTNPLTARVFVNRVWGELIGQPLVRTPSNFGALGEPPTHPQLLDDLASRFMENGWSMKWLVREIVTSATYQQSSVASDTHQQRDPGNRFVGRMNRRRLQVEEWRDRILAASGTLDNPIGGVSIEPQDTTQRRRTVYAKVSRFKLDPMLALFDFPDANVHAAKRVRTTTPLQKLFVLNHPFTLHHAEQIANQLSATSTDSSDKINRLYRRVLRRGPSDAEFKLANKFIDSELADQQDAWVQLAQALIASNEMFFVD